MEWPATPRIYFMPAPQENFCLSGSVARIISMYPLKYSVVQRPLCRVVVVVVVVVVPAFERVTSPSDTIALYISIQINGITENSHKR